MNKLFNSIILLLFFILSCSNRGEDLRLALKNNSEKNNVSEIKELVQKKELGRALYLAASSGYADIVDGLVKFGADIEEKSLDGATPLILFCRNNDIDAAKILIENGADVSAKDNNGYGILDSITDSYSKRQLLNYLNSATNVKGKEIVLDISKSDLDFTTTFKYYQPGYSVSESSYSGYKFYASEDNRRFGINRKVLMYLNTRVTNKDEYVLDNYLNIKLYVPKVEYNEYNMELSSGALVDKYTEGDSVVYELQIELYDDVDVQESSINNEFIFVIEGNDKIEIPIRLEFPSQYSKNNKQSTIEFSINDNYNNSYNSYDNYRSFRVN
ncbi:ankyrin repeat domain-containing protein [Brachyspira alvinipulli]|uniref:ankyrin repeat domain-containing protein n=1 Tax=Brachyspira alvinipulli TaxID=84379 RepID=UPI00048839C4|nr:ankyrin repeat domain-containing protein [Brachyspira alvinipulli]